MAVAGAVLAGVAAYLWRRHREPAFRRWMIAWTLFALASAFEMFAPLADVSRAAWVSYHVAHAGVVAFGAWMALEAARSQVKAGAFRNLWVAAVASTIWALGAGIAGSSRIVMFLPAGSLAVLSLLAVGWTFVRHPIVSRPWGYATALMFTLWAATGVAYYSGRFTGSAEGWLLSAGAAFQALAAASVLVGFYERERRQAEEAGAKWATLFRTSPDVICVNSLPDLVFVEVNDALPTVTGFTRDEVIGKTARQARLWKNAEDVSRLEHAIESGGAVEAFVATFRMKDGTERVGELSATVIEFAGAPALLSITRDITEQQEAARALEDSERRYRELVEETEDFVTVVDAAGRFVFVNERSETFLGVSSAEAIGMVAFDFIHPDDRDRTMEWLAELTASKATSGRIENRQVNSKTGEVRHCSWRSSLTYDDAGHLVRIGSMARDFSARLAATEALRASEEKFATAFRTSPDSININRMSDGLFLEVNDGFGQLTGWTAAEVAGKTSLDIDLWADAADRERLVEGLVRDGHVDGLEALFRMKDGSTTWASMSARIIQVGGEPCILSVTRDIDARVRAERELKRYREHLEEMVQERTRELRAANEGLERAKRIQANFVANMSHELRTPLNSIIGFSGVLAGGLAGPLNEEQLAQIQMISRSGKHLLALVNDVLDLQRLEAGAMNVNIDGIELRSFAEGLVETCAPLSADKGLELELDLPGVEEADVIRSDRRLLEQILLNLLGNAVKFTDTGCVKLTVMRVPGGAVSFAVADTGCGIEPQRIEAAFGEFVQIDSAQHGKPKGTGLGLPISRRLAVALGGSLSATSTPGEGSVFCLVVPDLTPLDAEQA